MDTTAMTQIAYLVIKDGCGEPDEVIGYFQTRGNAELAKFGADTRPMCRHEGVRIEEIEILP